ncbi:hypothetical protein GCM10009621_09570 [Corynebacterium felinum]
MDQDRDLPLLQHTQTPAVPGAHQALETTLVQAPVLGVVQVLVLGVVRALVLVGVDHQVE